MTDTAPPMPATWPALTLDAAVMDRLRTLWRIATTDDQRRHLERLVDEIDSVLMEAIEPVYVVEDE